MSTTTLTTWKPHRASALPSPVEVAAAGFPDCTAAFATANAASEYGGQLSFEEFDDYRMWDQTLYSGVDLTTFVGEAARQKLVKLLNKDLQDWGDKVALATALAAAGIQTIPTLASFVNTAYHAKQPTIAAPPAQATDINDPKAFADKLLTLPVPFFTKPRFGMKGLGTASFIASDATARTLTRADGVVVSVDDFMVEVNYRYGFYGYLVQPTITKMSSQMNALSGTRASTFHLLTVNRGKPFVHRASLKIATGSNIADNFWIPGNLVTTVDPVSGVLGLPVSGFGADWKQVPVAPDTNVPIPGITVANWQSLVTVALAGAAALPQYGLIGWDIMMASTGPLVVEANITPGFTLNQMADRRGVIDAALLAVL